MSEAIVKLTDRKRLLIFINIIITCIASAMLATALNTALPQLMESLEVSVNTVQWLTSGYALAMAVVLPLTGFLVTRIPTKRLYCGAISIFLIGLIICACSVNFPMMMVGRIIQACGNGVLINMAQVMILSMYPTEKRGTAMGWFGLAIGAAPVLAPTLGGLLVDWSGWRMIFIVDIGIMAIALIYALFVMADILPTKKCRFDIISLILSIISFGGVTLALGNLGDHKFVSCQVLLILIIGIIGGVLFVWRQYFIKSNPFLDIFTLKNPTYAVSVIANMILYLCLMGSAILIPVYVQQVKGKSATISGLVTLPGSAALTILSPFTGKIFDAIGVQLLFIVGSTLLTLSQFIMNIVTYQSSIWLVSGLNVIRSSACALLLMPIVTWGINALPKEQTSHATAVVNSLRTVAGAIGQAIFVSLFTNFTNSKKKSKGIEAPVYGMNMTFTSIGFVTILLILIALFGCGNCKENVEKIKNFFLKLSGKDIKKNAKEQSMVQVTVDEIDEAFSLEEGKIGVKDAKEKTEKLVKKKESIETLGNEDDQKETTINDDTSVETTIEIQENADNETVIDDIKEVKDTNENHQ